MSATVIVGIDEAGRGPLAGPVVAAACAIPHPTKLITEGRWEISLESPSKHTASSTIIGDSKQLQSEERESACTFLTQHCLWGTGSIDAQTIDRIGILEATQTAMQQALIMLARHITPTYVLIDGRDKFWFDYPHSSIIKGDSIEPTIAAASIIAKVTRDRFMVEADQAFPLYGFAQHKGYGTEGHRKAIALHGLCSVHRSTFIHTKTPNP